jgi:perosamine synthetase
MIKFSKSNINQKGLSLVNKVIKSGWLTHGKYTDLFEKEIKKYTGSKYAILVSSCTAGLHLSCLAAGFKKGDEVIVPAQTHTATAHAVEYTGAQAVLADVNFPKGNISYKTFLKKVTKKTKGLIVVHMAGYPCDLSKIIKFCKKNKIKVIEDCAHALGTKIKNKHAGNFGISGIFSFYPTKQISTGEGGAVITNDKNIYQKIKTLKAFGIDTDIKNRKKPGEYDVKSLGYNFRMTDFQAALGYQQIRDYKKNLQRRHFLAKQYIKNLSKNNNIQFTEYSKNASYFVFQIFLKNRDHLLEKFKANKIGVSIHYLKPLNLMSYYRNKYNYLSKDFKNSILFGKTNISLPIYPKLKISELNKICKILIKFSQ